MKKNKIFLVLVVFILMYTHSFALDLSNSNFCKDFAINIELGSRVEIVKDLQKVLQSQKEYKKLIITGYFGVQTQKALKNYQKSNEIVPSGILDRNTFIFIGKNVCKSKNLDTTLTTRTPSLAEVKNDYTIIEEPEIDIPVGASVYIPNKNNKTEYTNPKILNVEFSKMNFDSGQNEKNSVIEWSSVNTDYCLIYEIADTTNRPFVKNNLSDRKLDSSGSLRIRVGLTKTNDSAKNYNVFEVNCYSEKKKIIQRKTVVFQFI